MASFKLNLKALPFDSQSVNYRLGVDFFPGDEPTEVSAADVDVEIEVTRKSERDYALTMTCRGTLGIPCDRCLEPMEHHVDTTYHLNIRQEGEELDDSRDTVLVLPEAWHELDLAPIIRDTVLLTIPIMHTHDPGKCNPLMLERLSEHEASDHNDIENENENAPADPRWDALRKLIQ